jgi:hypothetical protein
MEIVMDDTTANNLAKVFLKQEHLTENKYTGKIMPLWNNQPETLKATLLSVFKVAQALFNYHLDIFDIRRTQIGGRENVQDISLLTRSPVVKQHMVLG